MEKFMPQMLQMLQELYCVNIKKVCWDKSLLNQFELKKLILPENKK